MDSAAWDDRYRGSDLVWSAEPNRWVREEAAGLAPGRALDLACGEGRNALWLAGLGWEVVGVDFSAVALAKAARLARSAASPSAAGGSASGGTTAGRVCWVRADATAPVLRPGTVDLVVVAYLQLAAAARRRAVRLAADALSPGGTLLVVGHDTANIADGTGGPQDPAVLFTAADVAGDLASAPGLVVDRADRVRRPVETDGGVRHALDALLRARRSTSAPVTGPV